MNGTRQGCERKYANDPEWREKHNAKARARLREKYANDAEYRTQKQRKMRICQAKLAEEARRKRWLRRIWKYLTAKRKPKRSNKKLRPRNCPACLRPIPPSAYGLRKYCNLTCKRANDERLRAAAKRTPNLITEDEWRRIQADQKHRCYYCRREARLQMDHVIPISKDGLHTAENIVGACVRCNGKKKDAICRLFP